MRVGIVTAVVAFLALFGAASHASQFPDLPGMHSASKAVEGRGATTSHSSNASAPAASSAPASQSHPSTAAAKPSSAGPILRLPGMNSTPVIGVSRTATRSRLPSTDALAVLAAIGTATALGMLWAVRRRFGG